MQTNQRVQGKVTKWVESMRYGWIENPERGGADIYVNYLQVPVRTSIGVRLQPGEIVEFEIKPTERGLRASHISFVSPAPTNS